MRVLHVVYTSLPDITGGSIRGQDILKAQSSLGIKTVAISSPFQPPQTSGVTDERFDDIQYVRTFSGVDEEVVSEVASPFGVQIRKMLRLKEFSDDIIKLALDFQPDVIHAHSSFFCGIAARRAARKLGVPLVYEIRSLWEERRRSESLLGRLSARAIRMMETWIARRADHVVTISEGLSKEFIARTGISVPVSVIGNAIADDLVEETIEQSVLPVCEGSDQPLSFGYVGNLSFFEGLSEFLDAWRAVEKDHDGVQLHFFGIGRDAEALEAKSRNLGLRRVHFHGRFDRQDLFSVYSRIDIVVIPRRKNLLSDTVTPIKPLEAMIFGKLVVVSPVGGLLELVEDGATGIVIEGSSEAAIRAGIERVIATPREQLARIADRGRQWVMEERRWSRNARRYREIYEDLVNAAPRD